MSTRDGPLASLVLTVAHMNQRILIARYNLKIVHAISLQISLTLALNSIIPLSEGLSTLNPKPLTLNPVFYLLQGYYKPLTLVQP